MKRTGDYDRSCQPIGWFRRKRWLCGCAAVLLAVAVPVGFSRAGAQQEPQRGGQQATGAVQAPASGQPAKPAPAPAAVQSPQKDAANHDAASPNRKKQIADESAILLKLATDLKAEVDKTTKDTLSLNVIRKADQIEKLAHSVKEQMTPAAGQN